MHIALLLIHAVCATFLIGAITHQAFSMLWPRKPGETNFVARYRGVNPAGYTDAIVIAFLVNIIIGAILYPLYRVQARPPLEDLGDLTTVGLFELKEHFLAITLGMLPAYWYFWRKRPDARITRNILTVFLAAVVWWAFFVGLYVNNVRGLI